MAKVVNSTSIGNKWQGSVNPDNRRKNNTDKKSNKKGK